MLTHPETYSQAYTGDKHKYTGPRLSIPIQQIDNDIDTIKQKIQVIKDKQGERMMFRSRVKWHEEGEKNNAYFLGLMNTKYSRLDLNKISDDNGTATTKKGIMEKVWNFYQKLYKTRILSRDYKEFLGNAPKISEASKNAMEEDITPHYNLSNIFVFSWTIR